jgi:hypothetical protein
LYDDDIDLETYQLRGKLGEPILVPLRRSVLDGYVLPFYVAKLAQSPPNFLGTGGITSRIDGREIPYPRNFLRLLRRSGNAERKEHGAKDNCEF